MSLCSIEPTPFSGVARRRCQSASALRGTRSRACFELEELEQRLLIGGIIEKQVPQLCDGLWGEAEQLRPDFPKAFVVKIHRSLRPFGGQTPVCGRFPVDRKPSTNESRSTRWRLSAYSCRKESAMRARTSTMNPEPHHR